MWMRDENQVCLPSRDITQTEVEQKMKTYTGTLCAISGASVAPSSDEPPPACSSGWQKAHLKGRWAS